MRKAVWGVWAVVALSTAGVACVARAGGGSGAARSRRRVLGARPVASLLTPPAPDLSYAGSDASGIPHYIARTFTADERSLLRRAFGIEDPSRLYLSDSTAARVLKYDTRRKTCRACYVNSYRVGFASIRRGGESWDALERRVRRMTRRDVGPAALGHHATLAALDPDVRAEVGRMVGDARRAGFAIRIVSTYRSPEREAYLLAMGGGRTHTLTSLHSYGRAVDLAVGDGDLRRPRTRDRWIAFRRWVSAYRGGEFRILGTPAHTWDWGHVEIPGSTLGFRSVDAALARARQCTARRPRDETGAEPGPTGCDFAPHLARAPTAMAARSRAP